MIIRLDPSFTEDDIQTVFNAIDVDHSKSIEFEELNAYYCKVNGLPFNLDESETHQFLKKWFVWYINNFRKDLSY